MNSQDSWLKSSQIIEGNRIKFKLENVCPLNDDKFDTLDSEVDIVLRDISATFVRRKKYLALSGGVDSEYIANRLLATNILFTPILLRIEETNCAELWYAKYWCQTHNIEPIILDTTITKILDYIKKSGSKQFLSNSIGGYINVFLADYVQSKFNGILLTGSGDPSTSSSGIFTNEKQLNLNPNLYYWDIDMMLEKMRPNQHPRYIFSYYPSTLYSWVYQFNPAIDEQIAKANMYNVPVRPKIDYFIHPEWHKYEKALTEFIVFENFNFGDKNQTLNWIKGVNNDNN